MEINNSNYISSYRKKRFYDNKDEISSQIEEVNNKLAKLSLNKTLKLSKNEYIFSLNTDDSDTTEDNDSVIKREIDMHLEKKLVESHYIKANKFLFDLMFNSD